jgi:hypothetical protein
MSDRSVPIFYAPIARYSSHTWTFLPVAIRAFRALAVLGLEWTTLDFIEKAPLVVRVSTFVVSCLVLAVIETREWLNFKWRHNFVVSMATLLALYLAVVVLAYWRYGEPPAFLSPVSGAAPAGVGPSVQPVPAPPPTKYSELEKEDLRNATRELSKILDGQGGEVAQKINDAFAAWNGLSGSPNRGGPQPVEASLESLSKSITDLRVALRDYTGPLQAYRSYADDISPLLNLSWASAERNALLGLGQSAGRFRANLSVLDQVVKCSDQNLLNSVLSLDFGESDLQAKQKEYLMWLQQTKRRIAAFRESRL